MMMHRLTNIKSDVSQYQVPCALNSRMLSEFIFSLTHDNRSHEHTLDLGGVAGVCTMENVSSD